MDRYAGKEWLPSRLKHLDFPESERADVVRGLRTYVLAGPANARRFAELYSQLPPRQSGVLELRHAREGLWRRQGRRSSRFRQGAAHREARTRARIAVSVFHPDAARHSPWWL